MTKKEHEESKAGDERPAELTGKGAGTTPDEERNKQFREAQETLVKISERDGRRDLTWTCVSILNGYLCGGGTSRPNAELVGKSMALAKELLAAVALEKTV